MASVATAGQFGSRNSAALLATLREAHGTLLAAMEVMDQVTRRPLPDRIQFTAGRWRISHASMARRSVWEACFRHLLPVVHPRTAQALDELNREDFELMHLSAAHIARWSADSVEQEWPTYCHASRAIRGQMAVRIAAEKRLLYPLLRL